MLADTSVSTYTTPALTTAMGTKYYICEVSGHCSSGQKIAVTAQLPSRSPSPSPPLSPSPSPAPPPATPPCFPAKAQVRLADGKFARLDALKAGDTILAVSEDGTLTSGALSTLSIADANAAATPFVNITGTAFSIMITAEHHLPVGAQCCSHLKKAKDVAVGDTVWTVGHAMRAATPHRVASIKPAVGAGLFSPVLANGAFPIVDGVVTAFDSIERMRLASYALAPLEAVCRATGSCALVRRAAFGASQKYIDELKTA